MIILCLGALACTDDLPSYPPLPKYDDGSSSGGSGGTGNSTGATSTGGSGKGGKPSSTGGSAGTGGMGTGANGSITDPLYAHCNEPWSGEEPPAGETECDLDALQDGGDLTGDLTADRTLQSGYYYTLKGVTRVMPGKKLTIEPCVKVIGENPDAVLVAMSGGLGDANCSYDSGLTPAPSAQLIAVGEPMAPIVFTSSKPKGERAPGDWGGVLLLGNAINNLAEPTTRVAIEGLEDTECHGWHTDAYNEESSGKLEYVRIEFASRQTNTGAETNSLTLGSVGSGTSIHHIMVSNSNDDCFEWFGGTSSAHHLIALNCDDDMFDADNGHSGQMQFLFGRQFPSTSEPDSRGFEIDSGPSPPPFTTSSWANFTICGGGPTDITPGRAGLALRSSAKVTMMNGFITGFAAGGITNQGNAESALTNTRVFGLENLLGDAHTGGVEWFTDQEGNSGEEPDRFCDCWAPKPIAVPATTLEGATPTGFQDESATYLGAFADSSAESNWMKGLWVDWSEN